MGRERMAKVRAVELEAAELVEGAAKMEREPSVRPQPAAEEPAVAPQLPPEVGKGRPRDLIRDTAVAVIRAHVLDRAEEDVCVEVTPRLPERRREHVGPVQRSEIAEVGDERVVGPLEHTRDLALVLRGPGRDHRGRGARCGRCVLYQGTKSAIARARSLSAWK